MDPFPLKSSLKPSSSCGFMNYSPNVRTLGPIPERAVKDGALLLFSPTKRELSNEEILKNELMHSNKSTIPTFYPTYNKKVKESQMFYATNHPLENIPSLHQSFPAKYAGPIGRKKIHKSEISTQTENTLYRKPLNGLSEYANWMITEVDPFLQVSLCDNFILL